MIMNNNIELLREIDELLAHFEDFTHGKNGDDITKMRSKISTFLNSNNLTDEEYWKKRCELSENLFKLRTKNAQEKTKESLNYYNNAIYDYVEFLNKEGTKESNSVFKDEK